MSTRADYRPNTDPKYHKGRKLNKRLRSMHISVLGFLKQHNWKHATRQKPVSADYQHERYCIITLMVLEQLPALGFEPTCLERLKPKHTRALVGLWDRDGLTPETIKKRLSILGWVCGILRKRDCMPEDVAALLEQPERLKIVTVAQKEKTFATHGIDFVEVILDIARHDARVALIQLLKAAFGLRNKEAIRLKPHEACHGQYLFVTRGTKGGRTRTVPYFDFESGLDPGEQEIVLWNLRENTFRVAVIELAKHLIVPGHSMIPSDYRADRYYRYERHVTAKYGRLTKDQLGVTPHAFRHMFLSYRAETASQVIRPLSRVIGLDGDELMRDRVGRQIAALDAGHHDIQTTGAYYGPMTERAPRGLVRKIAEYARGPVDAPLIDRLPDGRIVGGKGRRIRIAAKPPRQK